MKSVEAGDLELGDPLGGGDVAVEAGHHQTDGEAVLDGQGFAVHADGEQGVAAVGEHVERAAGGPAVDAVDRTMSASGSGPGSREEVVEAVRRASGRCR